MSLKETLNNDIKTAMKAKDKETLAVLRMIKTAVQAAEIDHWTKPTQASLKTMCVWFGQWTRFLRRRTQLQDASNRVQKWNVGKSFTVRRIWVWALQMILNG